MASEGGARAGSAPQPTILASFSTPYIDDDAHSGRKRNLMLAAQFLDGATLAPGESLSFNERVGARTAALGFQRAPVLRDGSISEDIGGGSCQVASTLHAAAFLAGLRIVDRTRHSMPSAYIRMGLDATVAYPQIDLQIQNTFDVPVTIRAQGSGGMVSVDIQAPWARHPSVTITSEILEVQKFRRSILRDASLPPGSVRVHSFGIPGYRVRRTRDIVSAGGATFREQFIDEYPPSEEVLEVAADVEFDRVIRGTGSAEAAGLRMMLSPSAVPPTPLQLRPSARVVLDNAPTLH